MMQKILFLFISFYSLLLGTDISFKPIDLSVENYEIGRSAFMYEDVNGSLTLSQIRQLPTKAFTPVEKPVSSHFFTHSTFWYRFTAHNKTHKSLARLIIFEPAWLDKINLTVVSPSGRSQTYLGGNTYPFSQRSIHHPFINFEYHFEPGISTVYVRVETRDPFIVSISIVEKALFLAQQLSATLLIGLIYGGVIAMLFYNLFLYFGIKERYYAYYVLYLAAFLMMNASYNGYTFVYFLSNNPTLQNWMQSTSIFLFSLAELLFASSFLNLRDNHRKLYVITRYFAVLVIALSLLSAMIDGYHYHVMFSILLVVLSGIYIFIIALISWLNGNRSARFFLLGATSGLVGGIVTALAVSSFIPFTYLTYKANDYGMFIDVVLLSMALAERVKITQDEKIIAQKDAHTDMLTGLLNRRAYYKTSIKEYERLMRLGKTMTVVAFDIDHFKKVNDTYGHHVGDTVLHQVAAIVKKIIRKYDYGFRLGGDEFLLLLPDADHADALHLAKRLKESIDKLAFTVDGRNFFITSSFGIAEYSREDTSIESIAKRADAALYLAKKCGRNRIEAL